MDAASGNGQGCCASSSRPLICVTCCGPVNPYSCHSLQHHIEDLTIDAQDSQVVDPLYVSNFDPSDALSGTDMSTFSWNSGSWDSSTWLRSSRNATEFNTASTGLSSIPSMDVQATASFATDRTGPSMECELPMIVPNPLHEPSMSQNVGHGARGRTMNSGGQKSLTAAAQAHMWHLLDRCRQERRFPHDREIRGLAMCEDLSADTVSAWFYRNFSQPQPSHLINPHCEEDRSPNSPSQNSPLSEDIVLQQVEEYARQKYSQDCSNPHSRKSAEAGGKYKCTSGCGFSTNARDAWQRHEQLRQPQDFWYCIVCRSLGRVAAVCSRNNHLNQHLENRHKEISKEEHNRVRDESKVNFENGFERHCKFLNRSGPCQYLFKSWKDRIQHYLHHFNDKIRDGPWTLRFHGRRWFDDDEDKDGHGSGTGTSGSSGSGWPSNFPSSSASTFSQSGQQMQVDGAYSYTLGVSVRKTILPPTTSDFSKNRGDATALPTNLIDVATLSWHHATPQSKYVALDDSSTAHFALYKWAFTSAQNGDGLRDLSRACAPFKEVLSLVRNMGYSLLWIDKLCESEDDAQRARALYEQAVLTIVLVSSPQQANKISHYTCHYQNIEQVRTWAVQSLPILHVQNLGHGAFGIVDEVRLGTASGIYARKMLLGPKAHNMLKSIQFREIEIMQKLRHENIAEFVAASSVHRTLNILMRPVAECSLRDFLVEPSKWAAKLRHVSRWMCSLASAVSYMHGLSLRHKDIKPANILIRGDDVYLSDFGAALDFSLSHNESSGSEGDALMTPRYCAPEVARREYRGRKADIFSLGCVFLETVTIDRGRSLDDVDRFLGHDGKKAGMKIAYRTSLKACGHWIDVLLEGTPSHYQRTSLNLCREMLAHDPHDRPSALRVHDELMSACSSLPSTPCFNDLVIRDAWTCLNVGASNDAPYFLKHDGAHDVFRISEFGNGYISGHQRDVLYPRALSPLALATDVWSFGVVLAKKLIWTIEGHEPFEEWLLERALISKRTSWIRSDISKSWQTIIFGIPLQGVRMGSTTCMQHVTESQLGSGTALTMPWCLTALEYSSKGGPGFLFGEDMKRHQDCSMTWTIMFGYSDSSQGEEQTKAFKQHYRSFGDQATMESETSVWSDTGKHLNVVPDDAWTRLAKDRMNPNGIDAGGLTTLASTTKTGKNLLEFDPLQNRHDVRLLRIHPSRDFDTALECELFAASLHTDVQYQALSYYWGSEKREHQVQCNGENILVTKNLLDVLQNVRQAGLFGQGKSLWVNAICIHQDTPQEKPQQIELMSEIFARAVSEIVWLGRPPQVETLWNVRGWTMQQRSLARKTIMLINDG